MVKDTDNNMTAADLVNVTDLRRPYTVWMIGENEYKLKLRTADILRIEDKLGESCVSVVMGDEMPRLMTMLTVIHAAMKTFHHGKTMDDVCNLFDEYTDNGGSQQDLYVNVFLPLFVDSGFFNLKQTQALQKVIDSMKT